jgi:DNA-binding response OmpR family regulator
MFPENLHAHIRRHRYTAILVWEEESSVRRFLIQLLSSCGYLPVESISGSANLSPSFLLGPQRLILVSAALPEAAVAMVKQVRAIEPCTPIIVCTNLRKLECEELALMLSGLTIVDRCPREIGKVVASLQSLLAPESR